MADRNGSGSPGERAPRAPSIPETLVAAERAVPSLAAVSLLALLAAGCGSVVLPDMAIEPPAHVGISLPPAPDGGYVLDKPYPLLTGDVIDITVREQPDLNCTIAIPGDGIIEVYQTQKDGGERETINTRGKTVEGLRDEIASIYQRVRFNFKPYVQVVLVKAMPRVVYVRGAIKSEKGIVELPPGSRMTLFRALQSCGGGTEDADLSRVSIDRKDAATGAKVSLPEFNLDEMVESSSFDRDPPLEPNDIVVVPLLGEVTIFGNINSPGRFRCRKGLTLLGLFGDAGGLKPFSKISDVRVTRGEGLAREKTYRVDAQAILDGTAQDPKLTRGDRVWIDEDWK